MRRLSKFNDPIVKAMPAYQDGQEAYKRYRSWFVNPYEGDKADAFDRGCEQAMMQEEQS
jgi:hypothetical protein